LNAQIPRIRDDDAGIPPPKLAIKDVFTSFCHGAPPGLYEIGPNTGD
jgi:hypothetical protein